MTNIADLSNLCSIRIGDALEQLRLLPDDFASVVITSPPYWGLRDYGVDGQIGLEPTLDDHMTMMVAVFDEVRRVLKPDGILWANYGDCYATTPNGRSAAKQNALGTDDRMFSDKPMSTIQGVLKAKDLCMLPNRFAIALQEAGWYVRSEIIWAKPNPMPESVRDRPATSHEKIFMLTKQPRYAYDTHAVRQGRVGNEDANNFRGGSYTGGRPGGRTAKGNKKVPSGWDPGKGAHGSFHKNGRAGGSIDEKQRGHGRRHAGFNDRWDHMPKSEQQANGRNLRNWEPAPMDVWVMATRPFSQAHFATFPPELVERCLDASGLQTAADNPDAMILDPFGGAGTTGLVASQRGFKSTLIELNPDYAAIAEDRINALYRGEIYRRNSAEQAGPLFADEKAQAS